MSNFRSSVQRSTGLTIYVYIVCLERMILMQSEEIPHMWIWNGRTESRVNRHWVDQTVFFYTGYNTKKDSFFQKLRARSILHSEGSSGIRSARVWFSNVWNRADIRRKRRDEDIRTKMSRQRHGDEDAKTKTPRRRC